MRRCGERVDKLSFVISYLLSVCIMISLLLAGALVHPNPAIRLLCLLLLILIALGWAKPIPPSPPP